jgi:septum formation protein
MLEQAGLAFEVLPADVDEAAMRAAMRRDSAAIGPRLVAERLARAKAEEVSRRRPDALVIGADQVLDLDGEIFAKPASREEARRQLSRLRGRAHSLPTAAAFAVRGQVVWTHVAQPRLHMRDFSPEFLEDYLERAGGAAMETVGGYALEGLGAQLFDQVEGDYFTVIGLPLLAVLNGLREQGALKS